MKAIKKTAEHVIYQKRSGRHAVRDARKRWVNGDAKASILLAAGLIPEPRTKAPAAVSEDAAADSGSE